MILELEKKVSENTLRIDELISNYFLKKITKKDFQQAVTISSDDELTFNQKVNLFCDMVNMSTLDKAAFRVYIKINNDLISDNLSDPDYFKNIKNYHTFLLNTYSTPTNTNSIPEQLFVATHRLSNNIVRLTQIYAEKPQIKHKKVNRIFSS